MEPTVKLKPLFNEIAAAIHDKDGLSDGIHAYNFPERVLAIPTGGVALQSIAVTTAPTKTAYTAGETFDPAGMVVTATFDNGKSFTVSNSELTFSPSGALPGGTTSITISYQWGTDIKTTTQAISTTLIVSVPTANTTSFTYNGDGHMPTFTYNSDYVTIGGDTSPKTNAGSYSTTFTLKESYMRWTDGTTAAKSIAWSIAKLSIAAPTANTTSFTYTGSGQSPVFTYNSTYVTASGDTAAKTNAGNYSATFTLKDTENTKWADNTTNAKSITWTIARASVAVPTVSGTKTYNGSEQTVTLNGYDSAKMTLGGTQKATNAGTYTATATPTANYQWTDGGTGAKNLPWTINKAAGSLTLSKSSVALNTSKLTDTVNVTRPGDGAITASSSNTGVATVSVSGTTVTITAVATGNATITISVAEGTNYTAPASKTVAVTAQFATIYGVEWDWTSSGATKGTRTDAAAGFSNPNPAVNNGNGSSPFDNLMPWSGMVKENRTGGVEVKEPKYWFKWTKTGKKLKLQIADGPVDGFHVDPVNMDRGDGLGELDFSYIGRYHCASGTYKSETNKAQQVSITRSAARTSIHNLGANFWQIDFAQFWYVGMLYLVEFADWNGQATIGYGCSASGSKENNGKTDAMQYHTGTTAANRTTYGYTQYRNIEGWWDNVYDWMDGCYYNSNGLNVIKNPNQFSDSANGTLVGKPVGGYPSDFTIPTTSGLEWALFPAAAAGSTTTYVPDYWNFNGSSACMFHGGYEDQLQNNGPFCVYCNYVQNSISYLGCRLQERPPKAA